MRTAPITGHRAGKNTRSFFVYTVYNNKTDFPVIVDGTAQECANAMGVVVSTFYSLLTWTGQGRNKKWTIIRTYIDELEED